MYWSLTMPNVWNDQASGLRRMMTGHQPKIVTVLSASSAESQPRLLTNLAATISAGDCDVLVVHAAQNSREILRHYGIENLPSLLDVAYQKSAIAQSVKSTKYGFSMAKLLPKTQKTISPNSHADKRLANIFTNLSGLFEVVLIDGALSKDYLLPLDTLNAHEILIQLNRDPESIKQGYVLIKQICSQIGRRSFGILVEGASDAQAAIVFRNISQAARKFMQIELEFFGAIPADEHLNRAEKLGRSVTEAFPTTKASLALSALAQRLNYQQNRTQEVELASFA
jgi:flagellar biosynthesis protein FlhG